MTATRNKNSAVTEALNFLPKRRGKLRSRQRKVAALHAPRENLEVVWGRGGGQKEPPTCVKTAPFT